MCRFILRILNCLGIALTGAMFLGGFNAFTAKMLFNAEISILAFITIFSLILFLLLANLGLYYTNPKLWEKVHTDRDNKSVLQLLPDIMEIIEFIDSVSVFNHK